MVATSLLGQRPNQTSGAFLLKVVRAAAETEGEEGVRRYALAFDVYIKSRSYAIINKICFWLSVLSSITVVIWPALIVLFLDLRLFSNSQFVNAAVTQTGITALAALFIYLYRFYKARQMHTENLLRLIAFGRLSLDELVQRVIDEMDRVDKGFAFKTGGSPEQSERPA